MTEKNHIVAFYSYTGNTKYLANKLGRELDSNQVYDINDCNDQKIQDSFSLTIMFAIHALNPPPQVIKWVKSLDKGKYHKVNIIAVGCNKEVINHNATARIKKILVKKGYNVGVDTVVSMPLTFITTASDDINKEIVKNAVLQMKTLGGAIKDGDVTHLEPSPVIKAIAGFAKIEQPAARLFGLELKANENCDSCGKCAKSCPANNITMDGNKPKFQFNCTMCLNCIYTCPNSAIAPMFSKFIPVKGGYCLDKFIDDISDADDDCLDPVADRKSVV